MKATNSRYTTTLTNLPPSIKAVKDWVGLRLIIIKRKWRFQVKYMEQLTFFPFGKHGPAVSRLVAKTAGPNGSAACQEMPTMRSRRYGGCILSGCAVAVVREFRPVTTTITTTGYCRRSSSSRGGCGGTCMWRSSVHSHVGVI